ncbi:MAG: bifunctional demethylmenaquinone methyltransferase/2-methoxy-6-polyprenyl-1,4-benzoquinol methylase UbiE [Desulfatiglandaceae bacterium]
MKIRKTPLRFNEKTSTIQPSDSETPPGNMVPFGYRQIPENEKAGWVLNHFNTVAGKYDFMNTLLSFGIHLLWKRTAVRMLSLQPGDQVIDVCGGTGDLALLAARNIGPTGSVVLYDINRAMMERGRPKVVRSPLGNRISFVQGNAEQIAFPGRTFHAAMVGFGVRNLTHLEKGFREMHRVLRPGGRLICLEFSIPTAPLFRRLYDFHSFHVMPLLGWLIGGSRQAYTYLPESIRTFPSPGRVATLMKDAGFSEVTFRRLTNGIAVAYLAKKEENMRGMI